MSLNYKKFKDSLWLLLGFFILFAYGYASQIDPNPIEKGAAKIKENTTNQIKIGQPFVIKLDTNPTTGYDWYFKISDTNMIFLEKELIVYDKKQKKTGAPSEKIWRFKAQKSGQTTIDFRYYRSWEGETNAINQKLFIISTK